MTRFGLRNLAELNLLDLLASVRHHYKASVRVRWFAQFTGGSCVRAACAVLQKSRCWCKQHTARRSTGPRLEIGSGRVGRVCVSCLCM
jgi:hypothetical protein